MRREGASGGAGAAADVEEGGEKAAGGFMGGNDGVDEFGRVFRW